MSINTPYTSLAFYSWLFENDNESIETSDHIPYDDTFKPDTSTSIGDNPSILNWKEIFRLRDP